MGKKLRSILLIVLIVIFIVSTTLYILELVDKKRSRDINDDALNLALGIAEAEEATEWIPAPVEDDPVIEQLEKINLEPLREKNEDVVGWIRIPGTQLDYPLMQGEDNEYYLNHAWNDSNSHSGAIFFESRSNTDLEDYNTIIYGHNMRDGSMFASLRLLKDEKFLKKCPYVYILTDEGIFRYEIFAVYDAALDSPAYGLSFNQTETKIKFLSHSKENSVVDVGIEPALTDRILTLSTCTNTNADTRWLVQARLPMIEVPVGENPAEEVPQDEEP